MLLVSCCEVRNSNDNMIGYGMVWYNMVRYSTVWNDVVPDGIEKYDMLYGVIKHVICCMV